MTAMSAIAPGRDRSRRRLGAGCQGVGQAQQAKFRRACTKRLRNVLSPLAHRSRQWNPWAARLQRHINVTIPGSSGPRADLRVAVGSAFSRWSVSRSSPRGRSARRWLTGAIRLWCRYRRNAMWSVSRSAAR